MLGVRFVAVLSDDDVFTTVARAAGRKAEAVWSYERANDPRPLAALTSLDTCERELRGFVVNREYHRR